MVDLITKKCEVCKLVCVQRLDYLVENIHIV